MGSARRLGVALVALGVFGVPQARAAGDCKALKGRSVITVPGIKVVERPFDRVGKRGGERGSEFHGCRKPRGPVYRLGRTVTRVGTDGEESPVAAFRVLQAQTAGLLVEQIEGARRRVDLVETRGGMRTPVEGAGVPRPAAQKLVLAESGAVAGVFADDPQRADSPNPGETLVLVIAGSGPDDQVLYDFSDRPPGETGPVIPPDSLRVEGGAVHWVSDGAARSAKLSARPPRPPRRRAGARCRSLRGRNLAKGSGARIKVVERRVDRDNAELIGCTRPNGPRYTLAATENASDQEQEDGGFVASSTVDANWFGGTFAGVLKSSFSDTAAAETSRTAYSVVDLRNGAATLLLAYTEEDDDVAEEARIQYDERGIALIDPDGAAGHLLRVFTPHGTQFMDRSTEPLTALAVKDGVVSWKRGPQARSRAIAR